MSTSVLPLPLETAWDRALRDAHAAWAGTPSDFNAKERNCFDYVVHGLNTAAFKGSTEWSKLTLTKILIGPALRALELRQSLVAAVLRDGGWLVHRSVVTDVVEAEEAFTATTSSSGGGGGGGGGEMYCTLGDGLDTLRIRRGECPVCFPYAAAVALMIGSNDGLTSSSLRGRNRFAEVETKKAPEQQGGEEEQGEEEEPRSLSRYKTGTGINVPAFTSFSQLP